MLSKFKYIKSTFLAACVLTWMACEKNSGFQDTSAVPEGSRVKFIHGSWNAPAVIFYGKDSTVKYSGGAVATGGLLTGLAYGSTYPSNDYAVVPASNDSVKIRVAQNATVAAGQFAALGKFAFDNNRYYSVFVVDSFPQNSALYVEDNLKRPEDFSKDSLINIRFVHMVYGGPAVDIFSRRANRVIFSNINYKQISEFQELTKYPIADTLTVRVANTTTVIATLNTFNPTNKRNYTLFARGRAGATTAATGLPALSFYTNQ